MTMSDDYAILFVGANGCSPVSGFGGGLYGMTILGDSVGANGCSPQEGEAFSQAQSRRQKGASLLTQGTARQCSFSNDPIGRRSHFLLDG